MPSTFRIRKKRHAVKTIPISLVSESSCEHERRYTHLWIITGYITYAKVLRNKHKAHGTKSYIVQNPVPLEN